MTQDATALAADMLEAARNNPETRVFTNAQIGKALAALAQPKPAEDVELLQPGDTALYCADPNFKVRCTFLRYVEGWCEVEWWGGSTTIVRPSRIARIDAKLGEKP